MYPSTSLFIAVGQLAIAILVMFSYPLQVHPCRNCLDKVFHAGHVLPSKTGEIGDAEEIEEVDEHGGSPALTRETAMVSSHPLRSRGDGAGSHRRARGLED